MPSIVLTIGWMRKDRKVGPGSAQIGEEPLNLAQAVAFPFFAEIAAKRFRQQVISNAFGLIVFRFL